MLANPHWNAPSFSSFESWLETKDPRETYPYSDTQNCACAQYLKAVGKFDPRWLADSKIGDMAHALNGLAAAHQYGMPDTPDYSFGGLLERVRKHRHLEPVA